MLKNLTVLAALHAAGQQAFYRPDLEAVASHGGCHALSDADFAASEALEMQGDLYAEDDDE